MCESILVAYTMWLKESLTSKLVRSLLYWRCSTGLRRESTGLIETAGFRNGDNKFGIVLAPLLNG